MIHPTRHGGKAAPPDVRLYVPKAAPHRGLLNDFHRWCEATLEEDGPGMARMAARIRRRHGISVLALAGHDVAGVRRG